jgi:hypothetical protein
VGDATWILLQIVVPAEHLESPSDRSASLEASLRRIGLPMERIQGGVELRGVLSAFLTPPPRQLGPAVVDISASGHLVFDGECVRALALCCSLTGASPMGCESTG